MEKSQKRINEVINQYDIDLAESKTLQGGWINQKIFIKDRKGNEYVLKELSLKKFPQYYFNTLCETVHIQDQLYNEKIKVPRIIKNKSGECITKIDNTYYFMQEFLKGNSKETSELTSKEIKDIGKNLGLIHIALKSKNIRHFNTELLKYKTIDILSEELNSRKAQIIHDTPQEYIEELNLHQEIIDDLRKTKFLEDKETQLIHGDFTPDNIIVSNNKLIGIIDFELVRINSTLQDIGRIVLSTCFYNNKFNSKKLNSFIKGYSEIISIDINTIINSIKMVWCNEINIWIQERYFKNYNPPKIEKFIEEMKWISSNWFNIQEIMKGVITSEESKYKIRH